MVVLDALLVVALPLMFKVIVDEVAKGGDGSKSVVVAVALGLTVAGVLLDQVLRRGTTLSVRLRDAEFE